MRSPGGATFPVGLIVVAWLLGPVAVGAQPPDADAAAQPPDSIATSARAAPDSAGATPDSAAAASDSVAVAAGREARPRPPGEGHRFELGVGAMQGFFDVGGSFGYRLYVGERWPFERSIMGEITGTGKEHLAEGTLSAYWLFRPVNSYRMSWRIRPLIEAGFGGHLVLQAASLEGFDRSVYGAKAYLKTHLYGGLEWMISGKLGLLARGRLSVPSHHTFDYAQAAILLR